MSKKDAPKDGEDTPKKKGSPVMLIAIVAVAMLAVGGGGAFAMVKMGVIGGEKAHVDNSPKLLLKGTVDPYAPKVEAKDGAPAEVDGDGGSPYQTSYFQFTDDFTSNLKGSNSLIQVSVACSTHRDGRIIMWLKKHELALRSAVLEVLADTPEDDINDATGKDRLRKRLTASINKVLTEEEGFGGVDNVYFRTFLVQ